MEDLTAFQRDCLHVLAALDEPYGLEVKTALEDYYGKEVNHGRLYPNLDELIERGLVEKASIDGRTNSYTLTDEGHERREARLEWERKNGQGES